MKPATSALADHLLGEVTTLCTCWKVTRDDGVVLGFTDHDQDVVLGGVTCAASTGCTPTAIDASATLAASNLDVDVVLDSAGITDTDLRAGLYDHAEVEVLLVNWAAPGDGSVVLSRGHLGEVKLNGPVATAEVRGLTQAFVTNVGEYFSADCRASLGDASCGIDLAAHTVLCTVATVESRRRFTATNAAPAVRVTLQDRIVVEGRPFTHPIPANAFVDADGGDLTYTARMGTASQSDGSPLPEWLLFDAPTRTFSGTAPVDSPDYTIRVTATDAGGSSVHGDFVLITAATDVNTPPRVAESLPDQTVTEDTAFSFSFSNTAFSDPDGDSLTYAAALGDGTALPEWLAFDPTDRTFSGTAPVEAPNLTLRVTASDGRGGSVYDDFVLFTSIADVAPQVEKGIYDGGLVTFTSGDCSGLKMEVKSSNGASVTLFMPMPRAIAVGDTFTLQPGCDRRVETCRQRFDNLVNFRGEPFVPGQDKAMEYPDARSG
nr:uncharacterized protein, phage-related [uncultured bacterium]